MSRINDIIKQLKNRKVIKSLAIYAGFSFIVIQACAIIFPSLLLPDWTMRLLIVLLIIGFLATFVLSWIYDLIPSDTRGTASGETKEDTQFQESNTPSANYKKNGKTWLIGLVVSVLIALAIISFYNNSSKINDEISIAILPFGNTIKDEDFNYLSQQFVDELTYKLQDINYLSIKDYSQVIKIFESISPSKANIIDIALAQQLGETIKVNYMLYGNYLIFNKELIRITCNLFDVENGAIKNSFQNTYNVVDLMKIFDIFPKEIETLINKSNLSPNSR